MTRSPYHLLTTTILDLASHPEVTAILDFAKGVVDRFRVDLGGAQDVTNESGDLFLLASFDKVTLCKAWLFQEEHITRTVTRKVGRFVCIPDDYSTPDVIKALSRPDGDVTTYLIMTLVCLRQIEVEGPSQMATTQLNSAYNELKGALGRALDAHEPT